MISITPDSNKRRIAWLPEHLVTALILGQMDRDHVQIAQAVSLPRNVKVVTVFAEPVRRAWGVVLQSEEWDHVEAGVQLPEIRIQFEVVRLARRGFDVFFEHSPALDPEILSSIARAVMCGERLRLPAQKTKELASRLQWLEAVAKAAAEVVAHSEGPDAGKHVQAWDALVDLLSAPGGNGTNEESEGKSDV